MCFFSFVGIDCAITERGKIVIGGVLKIIFGCGTEWSAAALIRKLFLSTLDDFEERSMLIRFQPKEKKEGVKRNACPIPFDAERVKSSIGLLTLT